MYQARQTIAWDHTAAICATVINSAPFRKGKAADPVELNPMRAEREDFDVESYVRKVMAVYGE